MAREEIARDEVKRFEFKETPKPFNHFYRAPTGRERLKAIVQEAVTNAIREELPWMIKLMMPTDSPVYADKDEPKRLMREFDKKLAAARRKA